MAASHDSDSESEEDPRVARLAEYAADHSPEEVAAQIAALGGEDAIIYGDLFASKPSHAKAHFLLMGAALLDKEAPLAPQLKERRALLKAVARSEGPDFGAALLPMLELYAAREHRSALEEFGPVLKELWERDVITDPQIEEWHGNENALQAFYPKFFDQDDAETIRESSREFLEWLQEGETES